PRRADLSRRDGRLIGGSAPCPGALRRDRGAVRDHQPGLERRRRTGGPRRARPMTTAATGRAPLTFRPLPAGLDSPRVVVDLARVEANIERLQAEMNRRGIALRPHAKTHKSVAIARMQLDAGARGITVGTLGE